MPKASSYGKNFMKDNFAKFNVNSGYSQIPTF